MKTLVLGIVLCLAASAGFAQQSDPNAPATREDIEHFLEVMHSREMIQQEADAMSKSMSKSMSKMVHDLYMKDKDNLPPDFEKKQLKLIGDMYKNMPFDDMLQAMVPVYQKHFTRGDVSAAIAFYSSPSGQKMIHELPAIMSEAMEQMMPIMQKYMQNKQQQIQEAFAQALNASNKKAD